jgi:antitoxin (DNA-binding transcriptional repressor) of toxin-antitoxin stability system
MQTSMQTASATEVQNNFGKYLHYAIEHGEVVILRNGKRVARIISEQAAAGYLTDSLRGILHEPCGDGEGQSARTAKYAQANTEQNT